MNDQSDTSQFRIDTLEDHNSIISYDTVRSTRSIGSASVEDKNKRRPRKKTEDDVPMIRPVTLVKLSVILFAISLALFWLLPIASTTIGKITGSTPIAVNSAWRTMIGMITATLGGASLPLALALRLFHNSTAIIRKIVSIIVITVSIAAIWTACNHVYDDHCVSQSSTIALEVCDLHGHHSA